MKLDLSELLAFVGRRHVLSIEEAPIVDEDLECSAPIVGSLTFTNTGSVLLIKGEVETQVIQACSRCLTYFEEGVHVAIDEQFPLESRPGGPRGKMITSVVEEEDENPAAGRLFAGSLLDLTELLRQTISVELPMQPLHAPDCKGLCPTCGVDRNQESCSCAATEAPSAFKGLAVLLERKSDSDAP